MAADAMIARLINNAMRELGGVGQTARNDLGLSPSTAQWSGGDALRFLERARRLTADDFLGLGASPCQQGALEFATEIALQAQTLRDGLRRHFRFMDFATKALRFELEESGDNAVIMIHEEPSTRDAAGFLGEWHANTVHKMAQWLVSSKIWLERAELTHPLQGRFQDYALLFGSNVEFNRPQIRLTFSRAFLDRKILRSALPEVFQGNFSNPPLSTTWKDLSYAILRKDLIAGRAPSSIESLADQLAVGSQTLRRRLRAEGSGYRQLKAQVRREMALDLFSERHTTIGEASIAAGFSEPNALTRALRGTLGVSSSQLRRQVETWGGEMTLRDAGKPRD